MSDEKFDESYRVLIDKIIDKANGLAQNISPENVGIALLNGHLMKQVRH